MQPEILNLHPAALLPPAADLRESRDPEHIARLADAMRQEGFTGVILGKRKGDKVEIIWGWTRCLAAMQAGLQSVPVQITARDLTESDILILQLQENDLRADFTDIERAKGYVRLMEINGLSQAELARRVGASPAEVSKTLAIFRKLSNVIQDMIGTGEGKLPPRGAYALTKLNDAELQLQLAEKCVKGLLKVERLEIEVDRLMGKKQKRAKPVKGRGRCSVWTFATDDREEALADAMNTAETIRRLIKLDLPLSSLPSLLKSA